jgi:hypothetical protein
MASAKMNRVGERAYRQLTARWLRDHGQAP